jgi:hypothetical protein
MGMSVIFKFCDSDRYNRYYLGGDRLLKFVCLMNENVLAVNYDGGASSFHDTFPSYEDITLYSLGATSILVVCREKYDCKDQSRPQ